jgi:hypothetical protein
MPPALEVIIEGKSIWRVDTINDGRVMAKV